MRRLLLQRGRFALDVARKPPTSRPLGANVSADVFNRPPCLRCQRRSLNLRSPNHPLKRTSRHAFRFWSTSAIRHNQSGSDSSGPRSGKSPSQAPRSAHTVDSIQKVRQENLPSHREEQRWDMSKRLSRLMDELQQRIADASQRVNSYTGTDYSGIATLRSEIKGQEQLVKDQRATVDEHKAAVDAAHAQRAASQKEVVGLLERKHSWSASDLERYMSLIRSEHINDQAVATAKENLRSAETALEETRALLEKRERAQYHEEQIWSDTIRRNSTWVTFGLMGANIVLLLASLVVIEPWRRRRMVKEIRGALDEQAGTSSETKANLDSVIRAARSALEGARSDAPTGDVTITSMDWRVSEKEGSHEATVEATGNPPPLEETRTADLGSLEHPSSEGVVQTPNSLSSPSIQASRMVEHVTKSLRNLFSDQPVSIKRIDITTVALEGVAAGAAIMGILLVLLRPN